LVIFIGWCLATHMIPLEPLSEIVLFEEVKEDGLQFKLRVELGSSQANVVFRVYRPDESHDREEMMSKKGFDQFSLRKDYAYDKKGLYVIQINNLDQQPALVVVRSTVDKPYEADDDFSELRKSLTTLENELGSTYHVNMQLKGMKEDHIREAKKTLKILMLLCALPLSYVVIGFLKLKKMKTFFQPRK